MKKVYLLSIVLLSLIAIVLFVLAYVTKNEKPLAVNNHTPDYNYDVKNNYTGSDYKGNYVYGAAMNLAWNDLNDNILHEKLRLRTNDKIALEMVDKFNNAVFTKDDLDEASYYIKSGYGQKTVNAINKESKEKFPSKSFDNLDLKLEDKDIISYAYFLKEVEYLIQFEKKDVLFKNKKVKGFYAKLPGQKNNVEILKYWDDDNFIIKLKLKDSDDELFLAKGFDMKNPKIIVDEINKYNENVLSTIAKEDKFEMPDLHLDHHREYKELIGKFLANEKFKPMGYEDWDFFIKVMFENVKFDMNYKGARVENEAVIVISSWGSMTREPKKIKQFILDKPFWVVMKRTDSQNPYFILGVNNTELMEED